MKSNWEHKRREWVQQSNIAITETSWLDANSLEDENSDLFFPLFNDLKSLPQNEQHWIRVLVGSAYVERIFSPTWDDIHTPGKSGTRRSETTINTDPQLPITLGIIFRFGFSQETIMLAIHSGLGNSFTSVWTHHLIAEFVGPSRFSCTVFSQVNTWSDRWWLQKGSCLIRHQWGNAHSYQEISHTSWLSDDEDAAPWNWPKSNAILVDEDNPVRMCKGYAEKLIVSRVSCQIVQTSICETPAPWSCPARNTLKQLCWGLKTRIIQGIHRESTPENLNLIHRLHFERDPVIPHVTPTTTGASMTYTPATDGPPNKILCLCQHATEGSHPLKSPGPHGLSSMSQWTPEDLRLTNKVWSASCTPTAATHSPVNLPPQQTYIKTPTGRTICLDITDRDVTIGTVKNLIWINEGIPATAYHLTANRKLLIDETKLTTITKTPPYFITVNFRLIGGSQKSTAKDSIAMKYTTWQENSLEPWAHNVRPRR